jgi:hypothetical protein
MLSKKNDALSISSDLADFSSGASEEETARGSPSMDSLLLRVCSLGEHEEPQAVTYKTDDMDLAKPPIMALGCDVMAHVLTFLEPPDTMDVLTMPLSQDWLNSFTRQPELWRVLCLLEPFRAKVGEDDESSDDESDSFPLDFRKELRQTFGKSRLLYTSFVRCMRYLARIKDDAFHGRVPTPVDFGTSGAGSQNLKDFLARARGVVVVGKQDADERLCSDISDDESNTEGQGGARRRCATATAIE